MTDHEQTIERYSKALGLQWEVMVMDPDPDTDVPQIISLRPDRTHVLIFPDNPDPHTPPIYLHELTRAYFAETRDTLFATRFIHTDDQGNYQEADRRNGALDLATTIVEVWNIEQMDRVDRGATDDYLSQATNSLTSADDERLRILGSVSNPMIRYTVIDELACLFAAALRTGRTNLAQELDNFSVRLKQGLSEEDMIKAQQLTLLYLEAPELSDNSGIALGQLEAVAQQTSAIFELPYALSIGTETIKDNEQNVWRVKLLANE